jgi:hypothetical protein
MTLYILLIISKLPLVQIHVQTKAQPNEASVGHGFVRIGP